MRLSGMHETRRRSRLDGVFIFGVASLLVLGSLSVASAARPLLYYYQALARHFMALGLGTVIFIAATSFAYEVYEDQMGFIYGLVLTALSAVLIVGTSHKGHRSWIHFGFFSFQPSEFARLGLILVLAAVLDKRAEKMDYASTILMALAILFPIAALILKQPDFSMTLTLFPIFLGMLFCAGAAWEHLAIFLGFSLATLTMPFLYIFLSIYYPQPHPWSLPAVLLSIFRHDIVAVLLISGIALFLGMIWYLGILARLRLRASVLVVSWIVLSAGFSSGIFVSHKLKGYQKSRFVAYLNPSSDIRGAAYHVRQSQIAIGSGGLWGKGLFSGTQSQLGFLPERHTDFIYSVIGEEVGFAGASVVLILYLLMIGRIAQTGMIARDRYGYLVCSGIASMFAVDFTLNVGMCLGLMPVAGIPLPLISYGGSSLVASLWSLGIVANIGKRRYALL